MYLKKSAKLYVITENSCTSKFIHRIYGRNASDEKLKCSLPLFQGNGLFRGVTLLGHQDRQMSRALIYIYETI